jgi:hypothetical protein
MTSMFRSKPKRTFAIHGSDSGFPDRVFMLDIIDAANKVPHTG